MKAKLVIGLICVGVISGLEFIVMVVLLTARTITPDVGGPLATTGIFFTLVALIAAKIISGDGGGTYCGYCKCPWPAQFACPRCGSQLR